MSLYFYSVNAAIAYAICRDFFGEYRVYAAEAFATDNPPSSDPQDIHWEMARHAVARDKGYTKFLQLRATLQTIATRKVQEGSLTPAQLELITEILARATPEEYHPVIYVILRSGIGSDRLEAVTDKPRDDSQEWIIHHLRDEDFEVVVTRLP